MQTFLPYCDIVKSIKCLDNKRLGKQRVEAYQIYRIVSGQDPNSRWRNHPAVKMWQGYADALAYYMDECIGEWCKRGYNNTMKYISFKNITLPIWFGNKEFHKSHKSNLLRKLPEHYSKYFKNIPNNLPYVWPV